MVFSSSLSHLAMLVSLSANTVLAAPRPSSPQSLSMNLKRRAPEARSADNIGNWAQAHKLNVEAKYRKTASSVEKRNSGQNLVVNQKADSSFFGSLAVGTPPVAYDVILDTGSADLWLASSECAASACDGVPTFKSSDSSTFQNKSTEFSITYGSGAAAGSLGEDVVQMAGFSVSNQVFGVCDQVSDGLLNSPVSGLLGLAFQTIASSGASPLWETLASSGAWDQPLMTFQLTRFNNDSKATDLEPGGTFTMGTTNTSLYTGDIDYNDIPDNDESYWLQTVSAITSQGNAITISSGSSALAAIDTGTTLIGGPADAVAEIYSNIPNSEAGTGQLDGYYIYPCSTTVNVTMAFGGKSWAISNADFQAEQLNSNTCMGAFFSLDTGDNAPSWIVGDTFLKNVYSVFRYNPASVGFAELSSEALAMNGVNAAVPSATIGSAAATVSATAGARDANNGAASFHSLSTGPVLSLLVITLTILFSSRLV
ncbi:aspartic peptidase domain-containing protein [Lentinula guzmanii]|uniref:Aspartic peptidase domain-containing protein n=1 Tax=Lentinula guzmanii TaxID=2804957 RepID=A0AA38J7Y8_9AGAR|nr:aspartic peptidase domain-containing protein [Lentinula guzmanii]